MSETNNEWINAAIRTLQELHAYITPHTVWMILDLQGIADDIPYEEIEAFCNNYRGNAKDR